MIKTYTKLDLGQTAEVKALLADCASVDAATSCVQIDNSLNALKEMRSWFLDYKQGELVAVGSVFAPRAEEAEISLCVHRDFRRANKGTALLASIKSELKAHGVGTILLVCDSKSVSGNGFVGAQSGMRIEHSEYTLELRARSRPAADRLAIVRATPDDADTIARICVDAFDGDMATTKPFIESSLRNEYRMGYTGKLNGESVCTCFLGYEEGQVSINTVAMVKREQGKGYAKEFLLRIINDHIDADRRIVINVDSYNMTAYNLYKKIGFAEIETIDYYELPDAEK
jgi:ribosomal protein S18 acetylase RimI-like enzyme